MQDHVDVIVIGSGMGGLSAALGLARTGQKVVVCERNPVPGGNCSAFQLGDYTFDLAVHQLAGIDERGNCARILEAYGIKDKLKFFKIDPFVTLILPDQEIPLPGNYADLEKIMIAQSPKSKKDIRKFFKIMLAWRQDIMITARIFQGKQAVEKSDYEKIGLLKKLTYPFTGLFWLFNSLKTADKFFSILTKNKYLITLFTACWPYLGLPPDRISGLMLMSCMSGLYGEHTYYPQGNSQKIADVFVQAIEENQGKVLLRSGVKKIIVQDNTAQGVILENGQKLFAKTIISNADVTQTFTKLIDPEAAPKKYIKKLSKLTPAVGPFKLFLGLDFDIAKNGLDKHEYFFYDSLDFTKCFEKLEKGYISCLSAYTPTHIEPGLAPKGHSTLILTAFLPWNTERDWRKAKEEIAEEMIKMAEQKVKNLSDHIVVKKVFTPQDLNNFSSSHQGAMYGWANTPDQSLIYRLRQTTPIKNLYLSGHWTIPGTGVTTAMLSGWILSRSLIKKL
ncbi:MAG: NAD(P)/FAD-dependent oxidoreductase [Candidatus Omnitrophota bacterium]